MIPKSIQNLIDELNKLPGVGPKSAERLVFYLLKRSDEEVKRLGEAVLVLKKGISLCPSCYQFSTNGTCMICADQSRDHTQICVVETIPDLMAIEKTGAYKGIYHVLHGRIDPLHHIGPEHIKLAQLQQRVHTDKNIEEIIIATDPDIEGETTALYIARLFEHRKLIITRIARGLPSGGNVEFADDMTIRNALKGRTNY